MVKRCRNDKGDYRNYKKELLTMIAKEFKSKFKFAEMQNGEHVQGTGSKIIRSCSKSAFWIIPLGIFDNRKFFGIDDSGYIDWYLIDVDWKLYEEPKPELPDPKPCPFCKCKEIKLNLNKQREAYECCCLQCDATGPSSPYRSTAIIYWDSRS